MSTNLEIVMQQLSNILYNCSQSASSVSKDGILDSIKGILRDYNYNIGYEKIKIIDWRGN